MIRQKGDSGMVMTKEDMQLIGKLKKFPADYWDFRKDDTKEFTHGIHNYPAMMVSPISRNIIKLVKSIRPVHALLDPFSGSGTTLVEGMLSGIENIAGNDINPLALLLTKVKTTPLQYDILMNEINQLLQRLVMRKSVLSNALNNVDSYIIDALQLDVTDKKGWGEEAHKYLKEYCLSKKIDITIPKFKNLGYWFRPRVIMELSIIKSEVEKIGDSDIRNFVFIALSECIRFVSNRRNGEFKMFRMPVDKVRNFTPDVYDEFKNILIRNANKMKEFTQVIEERGIHTQISVSRNNACTLNDVPNNTYDLIITSPPYGDSRTTVAYGEYSRLSLQWINIFDLSEKEIMGIDKSLMGGKKYKQGFNFSLQSATLKKSIDKIKNADPERAGDVYSFYVDLDASIKSVAEKTCSGGYQFWVVGNRTVKNELLHTDIIITELAKQHGLTTIYTIGRNIPNKVMPSLNSPSNISGEKGVTMTTEHIVILRKD